MKIPPMSRRIRKYLNKPVTVDGLRFDSKREYARWRELQLLERAGEITGLKRQHPFVLAPGVHILGEKRARPALRCIIDFVYFDVKAGKEIAEDVKSAMTAKLTSWRIKSHLLKSVCGVDVRVVK